MKYRQVELRRPGAQMVCWVNAHTKLRPHVTLTLVKMPDIIWHVVWVSEMAVEQEQRRTWRVGGIHDR